MQFAIRAIRLKKEGRFIKNIQNCLSDSNFQNISLFTFPDRKTSNQSRVLGIKNNYLSKKKLL